MLNRIVTEIARGVSALIALTDWVTRHVGRVVIAIINI